MRSAPVRSTRCAASSAAHGQPRRPRGCAPGRPPRRSARSGTQTAARSQASPAVTSWPATSASRASSACTSPVSRHASSQSSQRSPRRWCGRSRCSRRRPARSAAPSGQSAELHARVRHATTSSSRRTEVLQHDRRGVAAGPAGDRAARMRGAAGLVEAGDRHPVLRPARRGAQRAAVRQAAVAAVERAADHVRVRRPRCRPGCCTSAPRTTSSVKLGRELRAARRVLRAWPRPWPRPTALARRRAVGLGESSLTVWWPSGARAGSASGRRGDEQPRRVVDVAAVAQRAAVVDDCSAQPAKPGRHRAVPAGEHRRRGRGEVDGRMPGMPTSNVSTP